METRYDLRKIGIPHEQEDLNSHEAARLMVKEIERLREALEEISTCEDKPFSLYYADIAAIARSALQQKDSE